VLLISSLVLCIIALVLAVFNHYIQVFRQPTPLEWAIFSILILTTGILSLYSVMEAREYIEHFRPLRDDGYKPHRLSYEQVMENDFRKSIVETIIKSPGINYNRLRNSTNLSPGQFRWHINVLIDYKIIRKENHGNRVLFFAIDSDQENFNLLLNFPLRESIHEMIKENPGITASEIARRLDIPNQRNKVKYHLDILISAKYVTVAQKGKRKELYIL